MPPPPDDDEVARRLAAVVASVRTRFGDDVVARDGASVRLHAPAGACDMGWWEGRDEITLGVARGGRWELPRDVAAVAFVTEVVEAVLAGRVVEVSTTDRAAVAVTLADGRVERTSVRSAPRGCLPLPRRRSRAMHHVAYAPYR